MTSPDTRAMTLVDLPFIRRLSERGTILDCELGLTREARVASADLLSNVLIPRGKYTLITRASQQQIIGQFRYKPEDLTAHIVYIASNLEDNVISNEDGAWFHILDAMTREAGKHGAHAIVAEVESNSPLFEVMREARFASYTRQTIWRHAPIAMPSEKPSLMLRHEEANDQLNIMGLISVTVPTMLQQVTQPTSEMHGLVYYEDGRLHAYIAYGEGNQGLYLIPYIHPDAMDKASEILASAVDTILHTDAVPIYVCVRTHQSWLDTVMTQLNFEAWLEQAILVKHIANQQRHPGYAKKRVTGVLELAHGATTCTENLVLLNKEQQKTLWNDG